MWLLSYVIPNSKTAGLGLLKFLFYGIEQILWNISGFKDVAVSIKA